MNDDENNKLVSRSVTLPISQNTYIITRIVSIKTQKMTTMLEIESFLLAQTIEWSSKGISFSISL